MVMVNAYVFYHKYGKAGKCRTHQNFRGALIRALIEESADAPTPHRGRGKKVEPLRRLTERHFLLSTVQSQVLNVSDLWGIVKYVTLLNKCVKASKGSRLLTVAVFVTFLFVFQSALRYFILIRISKVLCQLITTVRAIRTKVHTWTYLLIIYLCTLLPYNR
jgi:hypothetical protein